jgi:quercetin dioxygenase-like cupin family protein
MARIRSKAQRRKFAELLSGSPSDTGDNMAKRYFVRPSDVPSYSPANHSGTTNRRLIGPETVGAVNVEVVLGVIEKDEGAAPHAHPGMEQVCYLLEGRALAEVDGERCEMRPGDACFFPAGRMHRFTAISDEPVKVLVIYSPPYGESPERVIRPK